MTLAPMRNYSRLMEKGRNVDGDESGGTSPSRQGAGTGILSPRNLFSMAAEIGIWLAEKGFWNQGFLRGGKNRGQRGSVCGGSSAAAGTGAKGGTGRTQR